MNNPILLWSAAAIFGLAGAALFNTMIRRKNAVAYAFAAVDVMLKKRYDLIPKLVDACQAHMGYEQEVLLEVTAARARAIQADDEARIRMEGEMTRQVRAVLALAEAYPELKAAESFDHLRRVITDVEEQIAAARRAYNAGVMAYNNACEMVPTNLAARLMGYKLKAMFDFDEAAVTATGRRQA
jgi:LemA protein